MPNFFIQENNIDTLYYQFFYKNFWNIMNYFFSQITKFLFVT